MNNPTKKTIDEMNAAELQTELTEYLLQAQSGPAAPAAATPKDADPRGTAVMKKPAHLLTKDDQDFLLSETRRVLSEMNYR